MFTKRVKPFIFDRRSAKRQGTVDEMSSRIQWFMIFMSSLPYAA
jgi:hypothetical protein